MKSILVYLVPPTHKLTKTFKKIDFQLLFSRDWDIFGTNGYLRWTRLKKFFKMSKSCFFRKNHRMDSIWPSVEVQILDEWSLMKIFWKVDEIWLILIRIFHWLFSWSWFVDIWSHLRINWQKLSEKSIFNCFFLETETFLGQTDTCVELVSKSSLKWAKVVFFEKITEWT